VIACDESPECIQDLVKEAEKRGITCVEAHVRRAEDLGIESASLDAVYGRWILSWLPDVPLVFDQVSRALRPGGAYILQEYVDWRSMRLLPRSRAFGTAIEACMASWSRSEGTIDIAEKVPDLAREAGLEVESFTINARTGRPGSPVWGWLGDFLTSYLGRLVRHGHFARDDYESFLVEWKERSLRPESVLIAPVVADVILRKSGT
jgi:SAM-dependent methyltransferase